MRIDHIIFAAALMLSGCKQLPPVVSNTTTEVRNDSVTNTTTEITTNETIKESDVAQSVAADSAYSALQFECDSLGNILLKSLEQEQGKRTNLELQLKGNVLKIKAIQEEFEIIVKGLKRDKEVLIKENTELKEKLSSVQSKENQEPVVVEKPIPIIVQVFAWIGGALTLLLLIWVVLKVYRRFVLKV